MTIPYYTQTTLITFLQESLNIQPHNNLVFFTVRFNQLKKDINHAKDSIRKIYARMLNQLQGKHWYKHPLPSVTIIEHGKANAYHVHSVFNLRRYSLNDLEAALRNTCWTYPYLYLTYDIQHDDKSELEHFTPIMNHMLVRKVFNEDVYNYVTKEYHLNSDKIDFGNLWTSEMMFKIP